MIMYLLIRMTSDNIRDNHTSLLPPLYPFPPISNFNLRSVHRYIIFARIMCNCCQLSIYFVYLFHTKIAHHGTCNFTYIYSSLFVVSHVIGEFKLKKHTLFQHDTSSHCLMTITAYTILDLLLWVWIWLASVRGQPSAIRIESRITHKHSQSLTPSCPLFHSIATRF